MKKAFKVLITTGCIVGALVAVVFINANLRTTLPKTAFINEVNVGGKSAKEAQKILQNDLKENGIRLSIDDADTMIKIDSELNLNEELTNLIRRSRMNIFLYNELKDNCKVPYGIKNKKKISNSIIKQLKKKYPATDETIKTKDATVDPEKLVIKKEIYGTELDYNKIEKKVVKELNKGNRTCKIKAKDYYKKPKLLKDDERLLNKLEFYKGYFENDFIVKYPNGKNKTLSRSQLYSMINYDLDTGQVTYNKENIILTTEELAKNIGQDKVSIKTHAGKKSLTDYNGIMKLDIDKSADALEQALLEKTDAELVYVDPEEIMKTRVEVDKDVQKVYLYVNNKMIYDTDCVTGRHNHDTPVGIFAVDYKATNVHLKGFNDDGSRYDSPVSYWMPFNGGIGLHDATWRGSFGGDIWYYDGSHGCVNLPYDAAKKIYKYVDTGTPVLVYR